MLEELLSVSSIITDLESTEKEEVYAEIVEKMVEKQSNIDRDEAIESLKKRESKMTTGILPGIAVPHAICNSVNGVEIVVGISKKGIDYDSLDKKPVHLIFMFLFAPDETEKHLKIMQTLASILQNADFYSEIMNKKTAAEIYDTICQFEQKIELI